MNQPITLSIIIVSWNTSEITCNCIDSIYSNTSEIDFEIIVVDNNSCDDSVAQIKQRFPEVIVIDNDHNAGFGKANNQGINTAKGEYVLLLNSDTIVLNDCLAKCIEYMESDLSVGVLGCKILNNDKTLQPSCSMFPSLTNKMIFTLGLHKIFPKNRFFGREKMTWWDSNDTREVNVVSGCFMMLRSDVIKLTKGFDERFFMYSEEIDWCLRISKHKWKIVYFHESEIIHLGGVSSIKYGSKRAIVNDASSVKFVFKHWPYWKCIVYIILMQIFYILRITFLLPMLIIKPKTYFQVYANHYTGLKNLIFFNKYLSDDFKGI